MDFILPIMILLVMFWLLRSIEQWLHRHVFKVGWLVTKSYETTTVLYYTFFLPGVFLNQLVYWLAAGVLNVRAERSIQYPEKQEIGELKLNFIRLNKKASPLKIAAISITPMLVAMVLIWLIAINIYDLPGILQAMAQEPGRSLAVGLERVTRVPDVWLWTYFVFTVANTMFPNRGALKGWMPVMIGFIVAAALVIIAGYGDEFGNVLAEPARDAINAASLLLGVIIAVDALALAVLALIENTIEWITGDSATFKNGKMIAMRRAEIKAMREAERQKERKRLEQKKLPAATTAAAVLPSGLPSIYALPFPVPGAPGSEPSTLILEPQKTTELDKARPAAPKVIEADAEVKTREDVPKMASPVFNVPAAKPPAPVKPIDEADEDAEEDADTSKPAQPARPSMMPTAMRPASGFGVRPFAKPEADEADEDAEEDADTSKPAQPARPSAMPSATRPASGLGVRPFAKPEADEADEDAEENADTSKPAQPAVKSASVFLIDEDEDGSVVYEDVDDSAPAPEDAIYDDYVDEDDADDPDSSDEDKLG